MEFTFRVCGPYAWIAIWKSVPNVSLKPAPGSAKSIANDPSDSIYKAVRTMVEFGIAPKVVDKPPSETVDGEVSAWQISDEDIAAFLLSMAEAMGYDSEESKAASEIVS